jgi:hypothetical protein
VPVLLPRVIATTEYFWPTGRIEGWYWQPELDLAVEYGAEVTALEQYVYETAPVLRTWAEWIIASQSDPGLPAFTIQQMAVKHWGRALIGKFGAQVPDWKPYAWFTDTDLELCRSVVDGRVGEMLTVGGRALRSEEKCYADNAFPALMSRVISECRMRLWRLMCAAGLEHVYYVDTDSLFVDREGSTNLQKSYVKRRGKGGASGSRPGTEKSPSSAPASSSPPVMDYASPGYLRTLFECCDGYSGLPRGTRPTWLLNTPRT